MGPLLVCSGMRKLAFGNVGRSASFNGAAARVQRNDAITTRACGLRSGFNGAAARVQRNGTS